MRINDHSWPYLDLPATHKFCLLIHQTRQNSKIMHTWKIYIGISYLYRSLGTIALFHCDPAVPVDVSRLFANPPVWRPCWFFDPIWQGQMSDAVYSCGNIQENPIQLIDVFFWRCWILRIYACIPHDLTPLSGSWWLVCMSMYVLNCLVHLDPPRPKYIGPIMELLRSGFFNQPEAAQSVL